MHQHYSGAGRLILTDRTAVLEAFDTYFEDHVADKLTGSQSLSLFRELDEQVVENMDDLMEGEPPADVITIYMPGLDHYAHVVAMPPDELRAEYLKKSLVPLMKNLRETLEKRCARRPQHGADLRSRPYRRRTRRSALAGPGRPRRAARTAGKERLHAAAVQTRCRRRCLLRHRARLPGRDGLYGADLSICAAGATPCDWHKPARKADIDAVAEAFYRNNRMGLLVPGIQGALDMILVCRQDSATGDVFQVYTGDGESQPLQA